MRVLERHSEIFLSFFLVASIRACEGIKLEKYIEVHVAHFLGSQSLEPRTWAVRSEVPEPSAEDTAVYLDIGFDSKLVLSLFSRAQRYLD